MTSRQTLFISYNWSDGNFYADEIERLLRNDFIVKRDKTSLAPNDSILEFMAKIADCENVVIILTEKYTHSVNCMLEVANLLKNDDWQLKTNILVIDSTLYDDKKLLELGEYWREQKDLLEQKKTKLILPESYEYLVEICDCLEDFFRAVKRRNNPSQISIVSTIKETSVRDRQQEKKYIDKGKTIVEEILNEYGSMPMSELYKRSGLTQAATRRIVSRLVQEGKVKPMGEGRPKEYMLKAN